MPKLAKKAKAVETLSWGWGILSADDFKLITASLRPVFSFIGGPPNCTQARHIDKRSRRNYAERINSTNLCILQHKDPEGVKGEFLGKIGQYPSVSMFNRLHVDFFQIFFIKLRYIPLKMISNLLKVLNLNDLFLKLNWPICKVEVGSARLQTWSISPLYSI